MILWPWIFFPSNSSGSIFNYFPITCRKTFEVPFVVPSFSHTVYIVPQLTNAHLIIIFIYSARYLCIIFFLTLWVTFHCLCRLPLLMHPTTTLFFLGISWNHNVSEKRPRVKCIGGERPGENALGRGSFGGSSIMRYLHGHLINH